MYVDQLMYWVSMNFYSKPIHSKVEMSSLNGTGRVTLLNESEAFYTGITLYNNFLYISDSYRRLAFYMYTTWYTFTNNSSLYALDQHWQ